MTETITNKFRYKRKIEFEELSERIKFTVDLPEVKRRSLPKVKLSEVEYEFLKALTEGRNQKEIMAGLRFLGVKKSYYQIMANILNKFNALTISNALYKAFKMGIIE